VGSNPAEDDGFLRAIRIHSTTSFGWEVKLSVPCKFLCHVKEHYRYEKKYFVGKMLDHFLPHISCFATRCLLVITRELSWMNQE
jgi:hypothetical protein